MPESYNNRFFANETLASFGHGAEFWAIVAAGAAISSVLVAVIGLFLARRWNESSGKRAEEISGEIGAIAQDIAQLAELTEISMREAAEREKTYVPAPRLVAIEEIHETTEPHVSLRRRVVVDMQMLGAAAYERARATRPEVRQRGMWEIAQMFDPTEGDVKEYDSQVKEYMQELEGHLAARGRYEEDLNRVIVVRLRIHNDGATPLEDTRLVLALPAGVEWRPGIRKPELLPEVPRYRDRLSVISMSSTIIDSIHPRDPFLIHSAFQAAAVSGEIEWQAGDVQHGAHLDVTPLVLAIDHAGDYDLGWRIHGDNLLKPVTGVLKLAVADGSDEPRHMSALADVGLDD